MGWRCWTACRMIGTKVCALTVALNQVNPCSYFILFMKKDKALPTHPRMKKPSDMACHFLKWKYVNCKELSCISIYVLKLDRRLWSLLLTCMRSSSETENTALKHECHGPPCLLRLCLSVNCTNRGKLRHEDAGKKKSQKVFLTSNSQRHEMRSKLKVVCGQVPGLQWNSGTRGKHYSLEQRAKWTTKPNLTQVWSDDIGNTFKKTQGYQRAYQHV